MTVLFRSDAEALDVDTAVETSVWDYTGSGNGTQARMTVRDDTPCPNSGLSKYFEVSTGGVTGTTTGTGATYIEDSTQSWTTDQWQQGSAGPTPNPDEPWQVRLSDGTYREIVSNTATRLSLSGTGTPASGAYSIVGQHDAWQQKSVTAISLSTSTVYYYGGFIRLDRGPSGLDVYRSDGLEYSTSKQQEFQGTGLRQIITTGISPWIMSHCDDVGGPCGGKYGIDFYFPESVCTGCEVDLPPNVAPYSASNPLLIEYEKWAAFVLAVRPHTGASGSAEFYLNGHKTHSYLNQKTTDAASPEIEVFEMMGTLAQPEYIGPAHKRKIALVLFADDIQDMIDAGLMEDPEAVQSASEDSEGQHFSRRFWGIPGHAGYSIGSPA